MSDNLEVGCILDDSLYSSSKTMEYSQGDIDIELIDRLHSSPVSRMFHERSVFITGASGFIGRVLLEKLLRTYPTIKRVYLLMRPKRNQKPSERLYKQLLNAPVFDKIRAMPNCAELFAKLEVITGDIAKPNLGISEEEMQMMLDDPSLGIVFHSAATVKFDEPLKVSLALNLIATQAIVDICKKLPNLVSLCHVSTAYVNSDVRDGRPIEEKVYPMRDDYRKLIELSEVLEEKLIDHLKPTLIKPRPNTYTYTKALAENLILEEASELPVAIVRPSIVVATWREPFAGWIDNMNGPTGLMLAMAKGLLRSKIMHPKNRCDLVPVDVVVNCLIAAAFYAASQSDTINKSLRDPSSPVPRKPLIIHCNTGDLNPIGIGDFFERCKLLYDRYPTMRANRYPVVPLYHSKRWPHLFVRIFIHYLPAFVLDLIRGLLGKRRKLMKFYNKFHNLLAIINHFFIVNFYFKSNNLEVLQNSLTETDRRELFMDLRHLNWDELLESYVLGTRRYLLKEADKTIPEARRRVNRIYYVELACRCLLLLMTVAIFLPRVY